jgi:5-methyltetrahydrofolate--homocysteine methyltransferase
MEEIAKLLEAGDDKKLAELVDQKLKAGVAASDILDQGLLMGMGRVGVKFRDGDIYLPEVLLAARAMKAATALLAPHLAAGDVGKKGTVVIGTVRGDLHDIGKNLVKIMLEGSGYKVVDLGADVAPEKFVDEAVKTGAMAIAMSALLTTTMRAMEETVQLLKDREGGSTIKVLVGGAPVTQDFCAQIGADGYGASAPHGVEVLDDFLAQ